VYYQDSSHAKSKPQQLLEGKSTPSQPKRGHNTRNENLMLRQEKRED